MLASCTILVSCISLNPPKNGSILCTLGDDGAPSYVDTCTYSCNTGYELTGDVNRTCESDGNWTGIAATCTQIRGVF